MKVHEKVSGRDRLNSHGALGGAFAGAYHPNPMIDFSRRCYYIDLLEKPGCT